MSSKPSVAIVGAGLAGLSAAYHLHELLPQASITIYESAHKAGGRILTQDGGEQGAEYFLGSELSGKHPPYQLPKTTKSINSLFRALGVKTDENDIPSGAYFWNGRYFSRRSLQSMFDRETAAKLRKIFGECRGSSNSKQRFPVRFPVWLGKRRGLSLASAGVRFIDMLLAGETCAPLEELKTSYALGALDSAVSTSELWVRIKGGSYALVEAFCQSFNSKRVRLHFGANIGQVVNTRRGPR